MIASAHVAAGAVVGMFAARSSGPRLMRVLVAIVLGIVGHLAMDAIPHSDYAFLPDRIIPWVGLGEAVVALGIVTVMAWSRVAYRDRLTLGAGVFASMAPDVKFVVRVIAPQHEDQVTRVTDAIHGLHATQPLHVWIAFGGEVLIAVGFFYLFWRLTNATRRAARPSA